MRHSVLLVALLALVALHDEHATGANAGALSGGKPLCDCPCLCCQDAGDKESCEACCNCSADNECSDECCGIKQGAASALLECDQAKAQAWNEQHGATPNAFTQKATENLLEAKLVLDGLDVRHFLAEGSLLGWHRGCSPIPWDKDSDIGILSKDLLVPVDSVVASMKLHGFAVHGQWGARDDGLVLGFIRNGVRTDLHVYYDDDKHGEYFYAKQWKKGGVNTRYSFTKFDLLPARVYGVEMFVPGPVERYLRESYGDFNRPVRDWEWWTGHKNAHAPTVSRSLLSEASDADPSCSTLLSSWSCNVDHDCYWNGSSCADAEDAFGSEICNDSTLGARAVMGTTAGCTTTRFECEDWTGHYPYTVVKYALLSPKSRACNEKLMELANQAERVSSEETGKGRLLKYNDNLNHYNSLTQPPSPAPATPASTTPSPTSSSTSGDSGRRLLGGESASSGWGSWTSCGSDKCEASCDEPTTNDVNAQNCDSCDAAVSCTFKYREFLDTEAIASGISCDSHVQVQLQAIGCPNAADCDDYSTCSHDGSTLKKKHICNKQSIRNQQQLEVTAIASAKTKREACIANVADSEFPDE